MCIFCNDPLVLRECPNRCSVYINFLSSPHNQRARVFIPSKDSPYDCRIPQHFTVRGNNRITAHQQIFSFRMAEIGDVRRFKNKKVLVAFAGIDAPPFQSGAFESKSRHVSKRGSPHLRRTIFIVSNIILTRSNPENAVYCFMDKKRSEGKHYYVYTVAGSAKFLRVYYARVTEFLRSQPSPDAC